MKRRMFFTFAVSLALLVPCRADSQRAMAAGDPNLKPDWDWQTKETQDLYISPRKTTEPDHIRIRLPFLMGGNRLTQGPGQIHP